MTETEIVTTAGDDVQVPIQVEAGVEAAVVREQAEFEVAVKSAKRFPRDENRSFTSAVKSFQRGKMAEAAAYTFPRGGKKVSGPSVDTARTVARCWGNMRWGLRQVSSDDKKIHIKAYAFDAQDNNYVEVEDKFDRLIQRKNKNGITAWVEPDERDLRELINRRGAIAVRNALLQVLPPDLVDTCMDEAEKTMRKAASGELQQSREEAIRRLVMSFDGLGVSQAMLEEYLAHALNLINQDELVELRRVWKSIHDGQTQRSEHFSFEKPTAAATAELNATVGDTAKAKKVVNK